eukprot:4448560-Prymnesium_polylepis.1
MKRAARCNGQARTRAGGGRGLEPGCLGPTHSCGARAPCCPPRCERLQSSRRLRPNRRQRPSNRGCGACRAGRSASAHWARARAATHANVQASESNPNKVIEPSTCSRAACVPPPPRESDRGHAMPLHLRESLEDFGHRLLERGRRVVVLHVRDRLWARAKEANPIGMSDETGFRRE